MAPLQSHQINKSRELAANQDAEGVDAKLTLCEHSRTRRDLASNELSVCSIALKAKIICFWLHRIIWVTKGVECFPMYNVSA